MSMLPGKKRAEHAKPRWDNDWYVEPPEAVHALLNNVRFVGRIHDPACGSGTIPKVAHHHGYRISVSDLVDRGFLGGYYGIDFLKDVTERDNIVTNPPYKLATEFALHALTVTEFKVAILVRVSFICGQKRCEILFKPYPPAVILFLSKRPSMPPGGTDIPAKGGTIDYCWIVWDHDHEGPTMARWAYDRP